MPEPEPEPEPEPSPPPDPLRQELETELALLALVRQTPWLASEWLQEDESEGQTLVRLIATAAQWNQVQELAEKLIKLCKTEQRPAKPAEKRLLAGSVALHNRIWKGRQASLEKVKPGAAYDYKTHQRGNDRGETIAAEWLPGLRNAAGELVCLPLVRTE